MGKICGNISLHATSWRSSKVCLEWKTCRGSLSGNSFPVLLHRLSGICENQRQTSCSGHQAILRKRGLSGSRLRFLKPSCAYKKVMKKAYSFRWSDSPVFCPHSGWWTLPVLWCHTNLCVWMDRQSSSWHLSCPFSCFCRQPLVNGNIILWKTFTDNCKIALK